jgi:hypothetical protein
MSGKKKSNYKNPVSATLEGIMAVFAKQEKVGSIRVTERLEGKTVLVDGASSGLDLPQPCRWLKGAPG